MIRKSFIITLFVILALSTILFYVTYSKLKRIVKNAQIKAEKAKPTVRGRDFKKSFDQYGVEGCFVLLDLDKDEIICYNPEECDQGYLPASTFKIANSLIALNEGVVKDNTEVFKWDGKKYAVEAWNRDQILASAIKYSCVWVFVKFAQKIGIKKYKKYLKDFNYGNQDLTGPPNRFWLEGPFKISANQQVIFLKSFYQYLLPLKSETIDRVMDLIILKKTPAYTLSGKTGGAKISPTEFIMWLVGYLEKGMDTYFYALNFKTKNFTKTRDGRMNITLNIFQKLGLVE